MCEQKHKFEEHPFAEQLRVTNSSDAASECLHKNLFSKYNFF